MDDHLRDVQNNALYSLPTHAHTQLPHACKVHGCSSQWRHTPTGSNW